MEIRDFLDTLWRRKWVIVFTFILTVVVAAVGSYVVTPTYTASALVRVASAPNPLTERADVQYAIRVMNTYAIIARSQPLLESVITELQLPMRSAQLGELIDVRVLEETELIRITANNSDAETAAQIANTVANTLITQTDVSIAGGSSASAAIQAQMEQVQQEIADLQTEYNEILTNNPGNTTRIAEINRESVIKQQTFETLLAQYDQTRLLESLRVNSISLIEPADAPTSPSSPRRTLNIALGALVGVLGGIGLVLLLSNLDKRIYTAAQVQHLVELPVLSEIYKVRKSQVNLPNMSPIQREAYRRLRVNIFSLQKDMPLKTVLVTSAEPDEGKSTIVSNLAMSVSQLGFRVLVVDCDLRRPAQHRIFESSNNVGLSTVLEKKVSVSEAIQSTKIPNLKLLSSGPVPEDPTALLSSSYTADVMKELAAKFDIVLLDTPALLPVIDPVVLAPMADGVLHVVRCGQSNSDNLTSTVGQIEEVQGRTIGVVLNAIPERASSASHYTTAPAT